MQSTAATQTNQAQNMSLCGLLTNVKNTMVADENTTAGNANQTNQTNQNTSDTYFISVFKPVENVTSVVKPELYIKSHYDFQIGEEHYKGKKYDREIINMLEQHIKGIPNLMFPVAKYVVPRLYDSQSWKDTERIACIVELE